MKSERSTQRFIGYMVALLGVTVAMRWVFQIDAIGALIPGSERMGIWNPVLFMCAGVCLVTMPRERPGGVGGVAGAVCTWLLMAGPLAFLVEHLFSVNLGIDFVRIPTLPTTGNPHPGRISPNACIGFLLAGIAFRIAGRPLNPARSRVLTVTIWAVTVVGLAGMVGHLLGLESLYKLASFNSMLPATAVGLLAVGTGLWFLRERLDTAAITSFEQHERRVIRRSAGVLMLVAIVAGAAGYAVLRETFESAVAESMRLAAMTNAKAFANNIESALALHRTMAARPSVRTALAAPAEAGAAAGLQRTAEGLLTGGFSAVRLAAAQTPATESAGRFMRDEALVRHRVLNTGLTTELVWQGGYVLYTESEVMDGLHRVGTVITEQRLPLLDSLLADIRGINDSADALVCGQEGANALCAPTRLYPSVVRIPMFDANGKLNLPINHALAGESGVTTTRDLRGTIVIAAFVPLAQFGLGLVVKSDAKTLDAPLKARMERLAAALVGLVMLGTLALHSHVKPLLVARRRSEDELQRAKADLQTTMDHMPSMIGYWNKELINGFANRVYYDWFGIPAEQVRGMHMKDVLGDPLFAKSRPFVEAVLTGAPQSFERAERQPNGQVRHSHVAYIPKLGDGDGEVIGFFVLVADITGRKQAEEALAASEQRYRALYGDTPAMMHSVDAGGRITTVSRKWLAKMGYDEDLVLGRPESDFMTQSSRIRHIDVQWPELMRIGSLRDAPVQLVTRRGDVIDTLLSTVCRRDDGGQTVGALAVFEDVTPRLRAEQRLVASEELMRTCGRIAGVGGWRVDLVARTLSWSDETRRIHEVDDTYVPVLEEAIDFYAPEARPIITQAVQEGMAHGKPWDLEIQLITAKGRPIWVRTAGEVEFDAGKPVRMFGAFQDITARKLLEQELVEKHELLRVTLKSIGDAVITTDGNGHIQWLNPVAERMTGWLCDEAVGKPLPMVFHIVNEETRLPAEDPVALCIERSSVSGRVTRTLLISRDGTEYGIEDSAAPIRDEAGTMLGAVLVFHDVSEQWRLSSEMSFRAKHDELTGLINRTEFESRLTRIVKCASEERTVNALLFIDLDQFKLVNDACGHTMGDRLLCEFSRVLESCVRARDTIGRLGGDEFGVLLEHCSVEQAQRVAQQICDRMEEFRFVHDGRRFRIGASIGLVPVDARWTRIDAALQAADTSCHAAKEAGRNRVHVWFDTDTSMREREGQTQWAGLIEEALDEDRFELYAQRIVPILTDDAALHFEVLLRLRQPDGSIVAPGVFLPAAERFHMASRIDRWVVREVFEWLHRDAGALDYLGVVSVNLSGQSIGDRAFHRFVVELIATLPIDASKLCFEVTETAAITNIADATSFIREMRKLGMRIALDDFGAGASSFGYLRALPVDYLKIDGQFVRELIDDPLDQAAVRCFQDVAKVVGVKTVAEFVENEDILNMLRTIGVDYAQGYLIHRPEPLAQFLAAAVTARQKTLRLER